MYIMRVAPWKSTKWTPPEGEDLITTDALFLEPGARDIRKATAAGAESDQQVEGIPDANERFGLSDVSGTGYKPEAAGVRGNSVA